MAVPVQCSTCGADYQVGEQFIGKKVRCKKCGAAMAVDDPVPELEAVEEEVAEEEEEDRPSRPRRPKPRRRNKSSGNLVGILVAVFGGVFVLAILGIGIAWAINNMGPSTPKGRMIATLSSLRPIQGNFGRDGYAVDFQMSEAPQPGITYHLVLAIGNDRGEVMISFFELQKMSGTLQVERWGFGPKQKPSGRLQAWIEKGAPGSKAGRERVSNTVSD